MELVESKIYDNDKLNSVIVETYLDDPSGIEETNIIIHFKDGSMKVLSFSREL